MELIEKVSRALIITVVGISLSLIIYNGVILGGFNVLN